MFSACTEKLCSGRFLLAAGAPALVKSPQYGQFEVEGMTELSVVVCGNDTKGTLNPVEK